MSPYEPCQFAPLDDEEIPAVVLDCGTATTKCGYSGGNGPDALLDPLVCHPLDPEEPTPNGQGFWCGAAAMQRACEGLPSCGPIEHGVIQDWQNMEKMWRHIFDNELRVEVNAQAEEYDDVAGVLLTEPQMNPKEARERTTEIMFETFNVRRFYMAGQATLSLYASGRTTGKRPVPTGHGNIII